VVKDLVIKQDMLLMPGTAFQPEDRRAIRVSISNLDGDRVADFAGRLRAAGG
jgi:hypothetical protein